MGKIDVETGIYHAPDFRDLQHLDELLYGAFDFREGRIEQSVTGNTVTVNFSSPRVHQRPTVFQRGPTVVHMYSEGLETVLGRQQGDKENVPRLGLDLNYQGPNYAALSIKRRREEPWWKWKKEPELAKPPTRYLGIKDINGFSWVTFTVPVLLERAGIVPVPGHRRGACFINPDIPGRSTRERPLVIIEVLGEYCRLFCSFPGHFKIGNATNPQIEVYSSVEQRGTTHVWIEEMKIDDFSDLANIAVGRGGRLTIQELQVPQEFPFLSYFYYMNVNGGRVDIESILGGQRELGNPLPPYDEGYVPGGNMKHGIITIGATNGATNGEKDYRVTIATCLSPKMRRFYTYGTSIVADKRDGIHFATRSGKSDGTSAITIVDGVLKRDNIGKKTDLGNGWSKAEAPWAGHTRLSVLFDPGNKLRYVVPFGQNMAPEVADMLLEDFIEQSSTG